jgi:hypothetical protein
MKYYYKIPYSQRDMERFKEIPCDFCYNLFLAKSIYAHCKEHSSYVHMHYFCNEVCLNIFVLQEKCTY